MKRSQQCSQVVDLSSADLSWFKSRKALFLHQIKGRNSTWSKLEHACLIWEFCTNVGKNCSLRFQNCLQISRRRYLNELKKNRTIVGHLSLDGFYNWNFTWTIVLGLAGMMNYPFLQMDSDGPICPSYWGHRGKDIERSQGNWLVCQVALNKERLHNGWEGLSSSLQATHHWRFQLVVFCLLFCFAIVCIMPICTVSEPCTVYLYYNLEYFSRSKE